MNFWDKVFEQPGRQPISPPLTPVHSGKAWWQDQDTVQSLVNSAVQGHDTPPAQGYGLTEQEIKQIRKRGHGQINPEQADAIAEYDLTHKDKYMQSCPQCGSGNFIPAGARMAGVVMPTNKCFDCGGGARSPEPAVGGGSGQGSISTRQIDTAGGGGNMYMVLSGTPRNYLPRN